MSALAKEAPRLMLDFEPAAGEGLFPGRASRRAFTPTQIVIASGSARMRLPVILKTAWARARAICGIASSPTPEIHLLVVLRNWMLTCGG